MKKKAVPIETVPPKKGAAKPKSHHKKEETFADFVTRRNKETSVKKSS